MYDTRDSVGHIDILRRIKSLSLSSPDCIPRAMSDDTVRDYCISKHGSIDVGEMVTCSVIISEFTTLIFGTKTGAVLATNDMTDESLIEVDGIRDIIVPSNDINSNPVTSLIPGAFWLTNKLVPACYVHYKSGHIVVIDIHRLEVLAYHYHHLDDDSDRYSKPYSKAFGFLLDSDYSIMSNINTLDIVKDMHMIRSRLSSSSVVSSSSVDSNNNTMDSANTAPSIPYTNTTPPSDILIDQMAPLKPPKPTGNTILMLILILILILMPKKDPHHFQSSTQREYLRQKRRLQPLFPFPGTPLVISFSSLVLLLLLLLLLLSRCSSSLSL
jgi:hypothetical protein